MVECDFTERATRVSHNEKNETPLRRPRTSLTQHVPDRLCAASLGRRRVRLARADQTAPRPFHAPRAATPGALRSPDSPSDHEPDPCVLVDRGHASAVQLGWSGWRPVLRHADVLPVAAPVAQVPAAGVLALSRRLSSAGGTKTASVEHRAGGAPVLGAGVGGRPASISDVQ